MTIRDNIQTNELRKKIAKRCRKLREEFNKDNVISLRQFGEKLGIYHSVISNIENENKEISSKELIAYADTCNVSTDYILCRIDDPTLDVDDKAISKKIGLSSKSISILENNKRLANLLNFLLDNENIDSTQNENRYNPCLLTEVLDFLRIREIGKQNHSSKSANTYKRMKEILQQAEQNDEMYKSVYIARINRALEYLYELYNL